MAIECTSKTNEEQAIAFLQQLGGKDITVEMKETEWWLGRYDKDDRHTLVKAEPEIIH